MNRVIAFFMANILLRDYRIEVKTRPSEENRVE
jgi:hypothetical protein